VAATADPEGVAPEAEKVAPGAATEMPDQAVAKVATAAPLAGQILLSNTAPLWRWRALSRALAL
jgi:hypothetical protein